MAWVDRVICKLIDDGIIEEEEREIYAYGLRQGIIILINILITILIGLLMDMVLEVIIFMVSYIPLRSYAGGYHARTQFKCFCYSILLIVVTLLGIKFIQWTSYSILESAFVSGAIIYLFAPVEDENKPLTEEETKIFRNRSRFILIIELITIIILVFINSISAASCILLAIFNLSIMLILGKLKNDTLSMAS